MQSMEESVDSPNSTSESSKPVNSILKLKIKMGLAKEVTSPLEASSQEINQGI
jgi:hypothetical protein